MAITSNWYSEIVLYFIIFFVCEILFQKSQQTFIFVSQFSLPFFLSPLFKLTIFGILAFAEIWQDIWICAHLLSFFCRDHRLFSQETTEYKQMYWKNGILEILGFHRMEVDRVEMIKHWCILEKGLCSLCSGRAPKNPDEKDIE